MKSAPHIWGADFMQTLFLIYKKTKENISAEDQDTPQLGRFSLKLLSTIYAG
jgi:hypothetical protein